MTKNAKLFVSVLKRCGFCTFNRLGKRYFGSDWRKCRDFSAVKFGTYYFLFAIVNDVPHFGFLPIDGSPVVTEKQFEAVATTLRWAHSMVFRSQEGWRESAELVSFNSNNFHSSLAGFLVSKGILQKEWLKRHKKFLIANSKNPKEPPSWDVTILDENTLWKVYKDGSIEFFAIHPAGLDPNDKDRMSDLYDLFSKTAEQARRIFFPSGEMEDVGYGYDLVVQFQRLVEEAVTLNQTTNPENTTANAL
jgi:hypothetical protein